MMILFAQDLTLNGGWIAASAAVFGIILGVIKLLDRLYLEPKAHRPESNGEVMRLKEAVEQLTRSQADLVQRIADSQSQLNLAVAELITDSKHWREIESIRHAEVMRSLDAMHAKLSNNTSL